IKRLEYYDYYGKLPGGGNSVTITVPKHATVVRGIVSRKSAGGSDSTYTFKNGDGTKTYGVASIPYTGGFSYVDLGEFTVSGDFPDNEIKIEIGGSVAQPAGFLAIEYF